MITARDDNSRYEITEWHHVCGSWNCVDAFLSLHVSIRYIHLVYWVGRYTDGRYSLHCSGNQPRLDGWEYIGGHCGGLQLCTVDEFLVSHFTSWPTAAAEIALVNLATDHRARARTYWLRSKWRRGHVRVALRVRYSRYCDISVFDKFDVFSRFL